MKYIFALLTLMFIGCANTFHIPKPKYLKNQNVIYIVPRFYSLVCSGKGAIDEAHCYDDCSYTIITPPDEKGCPSEIVIVEEEIRLENYDKTSECAEKTNK